MLKKSLISLIGIFTTVLLLSSCNATHITLLTPADEGNNGAVGGGGGSDAGVTPEEPADNKNVDSSIKIFGSPVEVDNTMSFSLAERDPFTGLSACLDGDDEVDSPSFIQFTEIAGELSDGIIIFLYKKDRSALDAPCFAQVIFNNATSSLTVVGFDGIGEPAYIEIENQFILTFGGGNDDKGGGGDSDYTKYFNLTGGSGDTMLFTSAIETDYPVSGECSPEDMQAINPEDSFIKLVRSSGVLSGQLMFTTGVNCFVSLASFGETTFYMMLGETPIMQMTYSYDEEHEVLTVVAPHDDDHGGGGGGGGDGDDGGGSPQQYDMNASVGLGGSIEPVGAFRVNEHSRQTFTITPASGYEISGVSIDGTPLPDISAIISSLSYSFPDVGSAHSIYVSFELIPILSNTKDFTEFSIIGQDSSSVNAAAATISVVMPYGSSLDGLVATFSTNSLVTSPVTVGGVPQTSNVTPNDFINGVPTSYRVVAEDGSPKDYAVTVTLAPISNVSIVTSSTYTVSSRGTTEEAIIDVPKGTSRNEFLGALIEGNSYQARNIDGVNDPVVTGDKLIVTAQDKSQTTYTITVDVYAIGETGPAGGLIFYVNPKYVSDGWRYLEAAPPLLRGDEAYDTSQAWNSISDPVGTGTGIGAGKVNTQTIVDQSGPGSAAYVCNNSSVDGIGGWFLPSKEELNLMYLNLAANGLGDFNMTDGYWSSSERREDTSSAWVQDLLYLYNRGNWSDSKGATYDIRCARTLTAALANKATVRSSVYTVSSGLTADETITNVPYGTSLTTFLAALKEGGTQTRNTEHMSNPVVTGDKLVVTAQSGSASADVTYTITARTSYLVGDRGPAGGIILYKDGVGEEKHLPEGYTYIEAAPKDLGDVYDGRRQWSNVTDGSVGVTGTEIGDGKTNSAHIIAQEGHEYSAAQACNDLDVEGITGWYLPSLQEVVLVFASRDGYGDFQRLFDWGYWSSSEVPFSPDDRTNAYLVQGDMWAGDHWIYRTPSYPKESSCMVRCVRYF